MNLAKIKVIGVGGGGGNAVNYMSNENFEDVVFCALNTDNQALNACEFISHKMTIGESITQGLGAGADPATGKEAAEADREKISDFIEDSNMVFVTAGMGGGTGTGAAPVVAQIAKEKDILTIGVVTRPFSFEGRKRNKIADSGIEELTKYVDSLIVIPNDNLLTVGKNLSVNDAFSMANDILLKAVKGVSELITKPGLINIDFADIKTVMKDSGYALMGIGISSGDNRAKEAIMEALESPLLDNLDIKGSKKLLINISANENLNISEFNEVLQIVESYADENALIVTGMSTDSSLGENLKITVVATGLNQKDVVENDYIIEDNSNKNALNDDDYSLNLVAESEEIIATKDEEEHDDESNKKTKFFQVPNFLQNK